MLRNATCYAHVHTFGTLEQVEQLCDKVDCTNMGQLQLVLPCLSLIVAGMLHHGIPRYTGRTAQSMLWHGMVTACYGMLWHSTA